METGSSVHHGQPPSPQEGLRNTTTKEVCQLIEKENSPRHRVVHRETYSKCDNFDIYMSTAMFLAAYLSKAIDSKFDRRYKRIL